MTPAPGPLSPDARLRAELRDRLVGGHAFVTVEAAVTGIREVWADARPVGEPHTLFELLWHVRFTQADILAFCLNPAYVAPPWPEAYWPGRDSEPGEWDALVEDVLTDVERLLILIDTEDLFAEFDHAPGYTLLREAMLAAEHAAYHVGQMVAVRRRLGLWPPRGEAQSG